MGPVAWFLIGSFVTVILWGLIVSRSKNTRARLSIVGGQILVLLGLWLVALLVVSIFVPTNHWQNIFR